MKRSRAPRVDVSSSVVFSGREHVGRGRVTNLSISGCTVETDDPVQMGDYLALSLHFPHQDPPLETDLAAVRWVEGKKAGLEFIRVSPDTQERLKQMTFSATVRMPDGRWVRIPM